MPPMKRQIIFFILLFAVFSGIGQNSYYSGQISSSKLACDNSISHNTFMKFYNEIKIQPSDEKKLSRSSIILRNSCLNTLQVTDIASLFSQDRQRFEFILSVYGQISDLENFFQVYDSFKGHSYVLLLYDIVKQDPGNAPLVDPPMSFPQLDYPPYMSYTGLKNCDMPMAERDFETLAREIFKQPSENDKLNRANNLLSINCLTTAQVMKITSLFKLENDRLVFLKNAFTSTYDAENYAYAKQLFSHVPYQHDLQNFINNHLIPVPPPPPPCFVSIEDMSQMKAALKKQDFDDTKVSLAKQIIRENKCFTASQIKEIVNLFGFESSKLEIAKYGFDFCVDKKNYYIVGEAFSFESSVNELMDYIKNK